MRVLIQKPDMDTCLTAFTLGVRAGTCEVEVLRGEAPQQDLNNAKVLCIEAGGSGQVHLNNFDHHNAESYLPPACLQALTLKGSYTPGMRRLVEYVAQVDEARPIQPPAAFPSLSNLFSGMLFVEKDPVRQLLAGIDIFAAILEWDIDPFGTMPSLAKWAGYVEAKRRNSEELGAMLARAQFFFSAKGRKIGFSEHQAIGGISALYTQGCSVVILYSREFGDPPVPKFTIAGNKVSVFHLKAILDRWEEGWGGRDTILGSPRRGSFLAKETVIRLVLENL